MRAMRRLPSGSPTWPRTAPTWWPPRRSGARSPRWCRCSCPCGHDRASSPAVPLLTDLLSAFEQDVVKQRYADRAELLDYCRRSANPIGRLLLHLYRVATSLAAPVRRHLPRCSLINFWQGPQRRCAPRGRHYYARSPIWRATALAGWGPGTTCRPARPIAEESELCPWHRSMTERSTARAPARAAPAGSCASWCRAGCASSTRSRRSGSTRSQRRPVLRWRDAPLLHLARYVAARRRCRRRA